MEFNIVTVEKQQRNFEQCMQVLRRVKHPDELAQVAKQVIKATDDNFYFFSKEGRSTFWAEYQKRKEELTKEETCQQTA